MRKGYKVAVLGLVIGVFAVLSAVPPVAAHHSFAAEFDGQRRVTLTGVVTRVEWANPHVWFYINVRDEATGQVTNWGAEMGPPHQLQRGGWTREALKIGEVVTVNNASMARNGSNRVNASSVTLASTGARPTTLDAASSENVTP